MEIKIMRVPNLRSCIQTQNGITQPSHYSYKLIKFTSYFLFNSNFAFFIYSVILTLRSTLMKKQADRKAQSRIFNDKRKTGNNGRLIQLCHVTYVKKFYKISNKSWIFILFFEGSKTLVEKDREYEISFETIF